MGPISTITIGEPDYNRDPDLPNILYACRRCTVVTPAGGIWDIWNGAFNSTEATIRELWEKEPQSFTKRICNTDN